jgi:hypothetical protein
MTPMPSSVTLDRVPKLDCDWHITAGADPCRRAANFRVTWTNTAGDFVVYQACYRHRFRMLEYFQDHNQTQREAIAALNSSKPASE